MRVRASSSATSRRTRPSTARSSSLYLPYTSLYLPTSPLYLTRYAPFYRSFGLSCSKTIDGESDICYCLKRQNNAYFNHHLLQGSLDLSQVVLIVDEVDDLVVNEKPSLLYNCADVSLTPHYRACYTALLRGEGQCPHHGCFEH